MKSGNQFKKTKTKTNKQKITDTRKLKQKLQWDPHRVGNATGIVFEQIKDKESSEKEYKQIIY